MLIARIKQFISYIFLKYDNSLDNEIKKLLSDYEFSLFSEMSNYDKVHSYKLLKKVKENKLLSSNNLFLKLALLHDCGKGNAPLFRRIKKVLIGDKILEKHTEIAFEKLKNHNLELAKLCYIHHNEIEDKYIKEFQRLDNE